MDRLHKPQPFLGGDGKNLRPLEDEGHEYDEEGRHRKESIRLYMSEEPRMYVKEEERMHLKEEERMGAEEMIGHRIEEQEGVIEELKERIEELERSRTRWKEEKAELQANQEIYDEKITQLLTEKDRLCSRLKRLKQTADESQQWVEELEMSRILLTEKDTLLSRQEKEKKKWEREKKTLVDQFDANSSEVRRLSLEREEVKKMNARHIRDIRELQNQLNEAGIALEQKNETLLLKDTETEELNRSHTECLSIIRDMREEMMDLRCNLTDSIVKREGTFMDETVCETVSVCHGTQRVISLAEEIAQAECSAEEEQKEKEVIKEEERSSVHVQVKRWLWNDCNNLVKGALVAGGVTLVYLVPLGLLASMVPSCYDRSSSLTCADMVWETARFLVEPYMHHTGLPPF